MRMPIASVIILFFPDEIEVVKNIKSYLEFVDHLYIIDNTPIKDSIKAPEYLDQFSSSAEYIRNNENIGVAAALNKALAFVKTKGFDWLLTMDQDSYFEAEQAKQYFKRFNENYYDSSNVAVVSLSHSRKDDSGSSTSAIEVTTAITSGSLVNIKICEQLGGFDEKLFIDEVDHEYCYRAITSGFKIIQFPDIYLNHQLGTKKEAGYFSVLKKSQRSIHSPFRVYFMVRNFLYVSSKYSKLLPDEFKKRRKGLQVVLKNNLFFSGHFFKVLVAIVRGYLHFKMNKFSK